MPCTWCMYITFPLLHLVSVQASPPGHHVEGMDGTSIIDHALCVVHLAASPYDGISPTAMMVCCPLSGGTRVDQHRGHAESVIGKEKENEHVYRSRAFRGRDYAE